MKLANSQARDPYDGDAGQAEHEQELAQGMPANDRARIGEDDVDLDPYVRFAMHLLQTSDPNHPRVSEAADIIRTNANRMAKPVDRSQDVFSQTPSLRERLEEEINQGKNDDSPKLDTNAAL